MAQARKKKTAVVQCQGGCRTQAAGGGEAEAGRCEKLAGAEAAGTACRWGCLGGGSCVAACRLDAIHINERGTAGVDPEKCVGCGLCAKACPRGLIRITGIEYNIYPACVSQDPGAETRKVCSTGCIACGICVKNCPAGAISIEEGHAVIGRDQCIACGMCAVKCPRGAIRDCNGIFTDREMQEGV